jgi:hypothetical protein
MHFVFYLFQEGMMVIVKLSGVVNLVAIQFGRLLTNHCQQDHFGHYFTGLLVGHRWAGTETPYFSNTDQNGKQESGMGNCQLRNEKYLTKPMVPVMLAYSMATQSPGKNGLSDWFSVTLSAIGEVGSALPDETVRNSITWIINPIGIDGGKKLKKY